MNPDISSHPSQEAPDLARLPNNLDDWAETASEHHDDGPEQTPSTLPNATNSDNTVVPASSSSTRLPHECTKCGKSFVSRSELKQHSEDHKGFRICKVPSCVGAKFPLAQFQPHRALQHDVNSLKRQGCDVPSCKLNVGDVPLKTSRKKHLAEHMELCQVPKVFHPEAKHPMFLPYPFGFRLGGEHTNILWEEFSKVNSHLSDPSSASKIRDLDRGRTGRLSLTEAERQLRLEILATNEAIAKQALEFEMEVGLKKIGRYCLGPRPTDGWIVRELCPKKAVIGLDTAVFERKARKNDPSATVRLRLPPSCEACQSWKAICRGLSMEYRATLGAPRPCAVGSCPNLGWLGGTHCEYHLHLPSHNTGPSTPRLELLREFGSRILHKPVSSWKIPKSHGPLLQQKYAIECGKAPNTDLLILDARFSPARPGARTRLLEICIFAYGVKDPILHARVVIKHRGVLETTIVPEKVDLLTMEQIAMKLEDAGVTKKSLVVSYGNGRGGWSHVHEALKMVQGEDAWPIQQNAYVLHEWFKANVEAGVPLFLQVVFRALFGGDHRLVGQDHRAKPAAEMISELFNRLSDSDLEE